MSQELRASFRFCPQCGGQLVVGANACPQCGFWVSDLLSTQSQTIVPAPLAGEQPPTPSAALPPMPSGTLPPTPSAVLPPMPSGTLPIVPSGGLMPAPSGGLAPDASAWLQTRPSGAFPPSPMPPTAPQAPGGPMPWGPPPDMPSFPTTFPPGVSGPLVGGAPTISGMYPGVAVGARPAGKAARVGSTLLKMLIGFVLAFVLLCGCAGLVLALRHHHLAQGYLYQNVQNGSMFYLHIAETWYGGDVVGTFYTPYLTPCPQGSQVKEIPLGFEGTVSDKQVLLIEKAFGAVVFQATFSRVGDDLLLSHTQVVGWTVPQGAAPIFRASSDANYAAAKQFLAQAACARR